MPDTSQTRPIQPPAGGLHNSTTLELRAARIAGSITQAEYRQYRDWYIGLVLLSSHSHNFCTRRLWTGLWLPLGIERREERREERYET